MLARRQQQAYGISEGHVIDPVGIGVGRLFFGDNQQYGRRTFIEQGTGLDQAMLQAVPGGGNCGHFAGFAAHDRPQADHGVMHREAELRGRQGLVGRQVAEDVKRARGFTVTRGKDQWQRFMAFGQWPADAECHARQAAEAAALHGG